MILTCAVLVFDIGAAFAFVGLLAAAGHEMPCTLTSLRRVVYAAAALAVGWRAVDIMESWRPISTVGAIFNFVMTTSLLTLAVVRRRLNSP